MDKIGVKEEVTQQLIASQLENWRIRMEDWRIASVVADVTGDVTDKERAKIELTKCVKAIEKLVLMQGERTDVQRKD